MRGPIDYIIVGFEGNKFDGSILAALAEAIDKGIIALVALSAVQRDENDQVTVLDIAQAGDDFVIDFMQKYVPEKSQADQDDITEVADLIQKNSTAGLLVVEQLWAKPLKQALINANGVLLAEGRIHPDAAEELEK